MTYPAVLDEVSTLREVLAGRSLARYGDGEFKMCRGAGIKSQAADAQLAARLTAILQESGECLVGIPNIRSETPKAEFWGKHTVFAPLLAARPYVSSFVTRPDSAPWIDTQAYWAMVESLWAGRDVTLVRGSGKSLTGEDLTRAGAVHEILAPRQHAWAEYARLLERVVSTQPTRVLLCLGPTATVMAADLCAQGIHAIDLGHVGMFLRKRRRGEALVVTDADRAIPA